MRLPDWEQRLSAFIAEHRDRPFQWGEWDCVLFATAAAAEITGTDEAAMFRGKYDSRKGSADVLRKLGKGTLLKTLDAHFERKPASMAQRGDLVWFAGSVGVCFGAHGLFVGEARLAKKAGVLLHEGLIAIPRRDWQKAWAV